MSGHSKWSSIKHKKAAKDAKRGAAFTKYIKQLTIAAREGGSDLVGNFALRSLVDKAKASNMPNETIERAIKRGAGELEGQQLVEAWYEGYGPGGVAVLVQTLSDNKNRTASDMRFTFSKYNGNLGEPGCVSWMFEKKGYFEVDAEEMDEEKIMEVAIEAGAEDVKVGDGIYEIYTDASDFQAVARNLTESGVEFSNGSLNMIPKTELVADEKLARAVLKMIDALEDNEDVQNVYTNIDIPSDVLELLDEE